jgi:hypothetical protein
LSAFHFFCFIYCLINGVHEWHWDSITRITKPFAPHPRKLISNISNGTVNLPFFRTSTFAQSYSCSCSSRNLVASELSSPYAVEKLGKVWKSIGKVFVGASSGNTYFPVDSYCSLNFRNLFRLMKLLLSYSFLFYLSLKLPTLDPANIPPSSQCFSMIALSRG